MLPPCQSHSLLQDDGSQQKSLNPLSLLACQTLSLSRAAPTQLFWSTFPLSMRCREGGTGFTTRRGRFSIPDPLCVCCVTPGKGIVSLSLLHGPRGGIKSTLKPAVRTKWSSTQKGLGTYFLHTSTATSTPPCLQQPHRQLEPQNLELSLAQGNSHHLPSKSGKKKKP